METMEELTFDNILEDVDLENLFTNTSEDSTEEPKDTPQNEEKSEETTTEIDTENLFESESVGSEETVDGDTSSTKESTPSNFFSSIAKAFVEEGIFPDIADDDINKVKDAESFRALVEEKIKLELDDRQKRIDEALGYGIEPSVIKQYENTINYLDSITEANLTDEDEKGEILRKNLIAQDYINRGYSKERAYKAVEKSFKNGDDIEDAREALLSNKEFFQGKYDNLLKEAKQEQEKEVQARQKQADELKNSILNDKKFFGELELDKQTRQKVYDTIAKPVYKDPKTGEVFTAIQKYEMDNRTDFLKYLGLCYTLTNGFKNLDNLVKGKVNKEVKKGLRDLENTLNNTARTSDGKLNYVSGVDSESFIGRGWKLDI